ncbi:Alpha-D-glucose-1-phosphate phosphatase YihX [Nonomuraea coxensis DSM 45129]|uniref:Alpha-D-glucose-1-phosphate phosphatase YihX n=1 Tax=Nonomuraea coxensis DSM 45129 TaxID=1122611 RepID=A0ABX8U0E7_9ACTN|nr:HAD family phosphatase [Nonomuraea coxensis]QYC41105.1 Alpha-D-glucose-1-phosphate phosphatase YihX [Nonomuraea coxensis DSM 45129]
MTWIVFDYGGVLSLPQPESDALEMARAMGAEPEAFLTGYWRHRLDFDRAGLTPHAYWAAVLGRSVTHSEVARLVAMDLAGWAHPDEGTVALLGELLADGRDVALLSNAPVCLSDGLDELPWIAAIGRRFYSGRMGLVKPDRKIYDEVARELDADPADVVFIDDRPENVEGAERAGMTGLLFTGSADLRAGLRGVLAA